MARWMCDPGVIRAVGGRPELGPLRQPLFTRFAGYAGGIICNPWWFVCFPGAVPVEQVLGSRSTWDPGVNVGLGFQIDMGGGSGGAKFFVESRYQYIRGDEIENPLTGNKERGNTQNVTVSGGFRF